MNTQDYNDMIVKPALIYAIRAGTVDGTFNDPVCLLIMIKDRELRSALLERLADIENV